MPPQGPTVRAGTKWQQTQCVKITWLVQKLGQYMWWSCIGEGLLNQWSCKCYLFLGWNISHVTQFLSQNVCFCFFGVTLTVFTVIYCIYCIDCTVTLSVTCSINSFHSSKATSWPIESISCGMSVRVLIPPPLPPPGERSMHPTFCYGWAKKNKTNW